MGIDQAAEKQILELEQALKEARDTIAALAKERAAILGQLDSLKKQQEDYLIGQ